MASLGAITLVVFNYIGDKEADLQEEQKQIIVD